MKVKEIDNFLDENDIEVEYKVFEEDDEYRIILESNYIFIPSLNINIHSGYYEVYSEDTEDYEIDFDFYMFFDSETKEHVYEEQGSGLEVCIYNYLRGIGKTVQDIDLIEEAECEIKDLLIRQ